MSLTKVAPLDMTELVRQYGGNLPINFSAYYAGAGLVPPGTTNGANLKIPSSGDMYLSDFLGSPNGIQWVDYFANMGYYWRNYPNYQAAQTPTISTNNGNAPNYSDPPGGGDWGQAQYWQNYYFSNAGLKVSNGCTVVYTLTGTDLSSDTVMGARPGGSATGAVQVSEGYQAFYVWTEGSKHLLAPTFLYVDYKDTNTKVLTVVAWYACSATAITKVTIGYCPNGRYKHHTSQYPGVVIVPGYWTPIPYAFVGAGAYALSVPTNTWSFTCSYRDDDNNYQLEKSSGMTYVIEYDDHWYSNTEYQLNFNATATAQSVTYSAHGSGENGVVYNFTQTSGGYNGPNVPNSSTLRGFGSAIVQARTAQSKSGGTSQAATVFFLPSGGAYGSGDGGNTVQSYDNTDFGGGADVVPAWYVGSTLTGPPPGNIYWIRATSSATTGNDAKIGLWVALSATVRYDWTYTAAGSSSAQYTYQIATDSSGGGALTIGTTTMLVINAGSTTGGSTGGGCVAVNMMMDPQRAASGINVGDEVDGVSYNPDGMIKRVVRSNIQQLEHVWRMTTVSGIQLEASDSTPVTLRNGSSKLFPDMLGEDVLVNDQGFIRWEKVIKMDDLDYQVVVRFSVDDHSYFSGVRGDRRIATHNVLK